MADGGVDVDNNAGAARSLSTTTAEAEADVLGRGYFRGLPRRAGCCDDVGGVGGGRQQGGGVFGGAIMDRSGVTGDADADVDVGNTGMGE